MRVSYAAVLRVVTQRSSETTATTEPGTGTGYMVYGITRNGQGRFEDFNVFAFIFCKVFPYEINSFLQY